MHTEKPNDPEITASAIPPIPFEVDLRALVIGPERITWLGALLETARAELRPRDFAERHYVEEMAINKWRLLRVYAMEKSVYEQQSATWRSQPASNEPCEHADIYHLAQANKHDQDAVILNALSRLETRFHRQFTTAHRMFLTLRKTNPFAPYPTEAAAAKD